MRKTDLAYFAGIFDGEGCIFLSPQNNALKNHHQQHLTFTMRAQIVSTNEWICQQFRFSFGGVISIDRQEGNHKIAYRWVITAKNAMNFLTALMPYLNLKRPQATLAIQFQQHKIRGGRKTKNYLDFETDFKKEFSRLNYRGKI